jgi:hypothetical protein
MASVSVSRELRVGIWHRLGAGALVIGLVALKVRAMLGPHEDWPFTSAPMFARYHSPDQPLFELRLIAQHADGSEHEIVPQRDLGLGELAFRRQFFAKHYGSADPRHPGGHLENDTREAFERRLGAWMRRVAGVYQRRTGRVLAGVSVEVRRVTATGSESKRVAKLDLGW